MIPAGSKTSLMARSDAWKSAVSRSYHSWWTRPTAWWWVMVAPWSARMSEAVRLIDRHCSSSRPPLGRRHEREVGGRPVRVDVREPAGDVAGPAGLLHGRGHAVVDVRAEVVEAVPGDGRLEGVEDDAQADERVPEVRRLDERRPPPLLGGLLVALAVAVDRPAGTLAAVGLADGQRLPEVLPGRPRLAQRLEPQKEEVVVVGRELEQRGLVAVQQAAVRGGEARLRDLPRGVDRGVELREPHRRARAPRRAGLDRHPGLRDHAQRPLRAEDEVVVLRPGGRPGHFLCLDGPRGRDHPRALDEVVDVRVIGREVPARVGGDPPAQRRELVGLGVVPELEAVVGEAVLDLRAERAGLNARPAGLLVDREDRVHPAGVQRDDARVPAADVALDAADDAGPAAVGNDRDALLGGPLQQGGDLVLGLGLRDDVGCRPEVPPEATDLVPVGVAVGVVDPAAPVRRAEPEVGDPDAGLGHVDVRQVRRVDWVQFREAEVRLQAPAQPLDALLVRVALDVPPAPVTPGAAVAHARSPRRVRSVVSPFVTVGSSSSMPDRTCTGPRITTM